MKCKMKNYLIRAQVIINDVMKEHFYLMEFSGKKEVKHYLEICYPRTKVQVFCLGTCLIDTITKRKRQQIKLVREKENLE